MPVTLDELAIRIPASIELFERFGLDYYQNGQQTLREACLSVGLSFSAIDAELSQLEEAQLTLDDMSADRLIDFLNGRCHASEKELLRSVHAAIRKQMKTATGAEETVLLLIEPLFCEFRELLLEHCRKEDELFFPFMRKLVALHRSRELKVPGASGFIRNPLLILESEHNDITDLLVTIKQTAHQFLPGTESTPGYQALMQQLILFERDLHLHLHIENNILFPKLLLLEEEVSQQLNA
jgi:regulator of cell morphogenesis and NO signaling